MLWHYFGDISYNVSCILYSHPKVTNGLVRIVNNLMDVDAEVLEAAQNDDQSPTEITQLLELQLNTIIIAPGESIYEETLNNVVAMVSHDVDHSIGSQDNCRLKNYAEIMNHGYYKYCVNTNSYK